MLRKRQERPSGGAPLIVAISASGRQGNPTGYEPTLFDFNLVKPVPMEVLAEILRPLRGP